jgi:hypothetical protein
MWQGGAIMNRPDIKTGDIPAGYRAYNGHIFSEYEAQRYNQKSRDVELNLNHARGLERALDARHKTFCMITGCNEPATVKEVQS